MSHKVKHISATHLFSEQSLNFWQTSILVACLLFNWFLLVIYWTYTYCGTNNRFCKWVFIIRLIINFKKSCTTLNSNSLTFLQALNLHHHTFTPCNSQTFMWWKFWVLLCWWRIQIHENYFLFGFHFR